MMQKYYSRIILDDDFIIDGFYLFKTKNSNYSLLLSRKASSIILSNDLVEDILNKNLDKNLKMKLISRGMARFKNLKIKEFRDDNIYFIIDLTKNCNFDCLYCFRNLNDKRVISTNVLKDICDFIKDYSINKNKTKVQIQAWGGEAVLALSKIEYIYNYFKDSNISLKIDIETNGSLITDKIAKKLFSMNIGVGISIDGLKKHQDIQRRLVNKDSSYDLVKKGISNLKKYYKDDLSGICVVTKYNYKDIPSIINHLVSELDIHKMKFNIVKDNPNANEERISLTKEQVIEFANSLYDTILLYKMMGINFEEGNILIRYNNLISRNPFSYCISNGCRGGKNLISIDMNGNIYPCEMMDYKEVKLSSIYNEDNSLKDYSTFEKKLTNIRKNNIYFKKKENNKCHKCPWFYYCKGGCTSRIIYSDNTMKYDEIECEFNKVIYPKLIKNILEKEVM